MDASSTCPALDAPLAAWAHWYAAQGWPVFPCHGKAPITRRGFYDATSDPPQIDSWWAQWPTANIGAPMGHWAWALDEDPRNGGDSTRAELERNYGELPVTLQSLSGRKDGGCHRFFLLPETLKHKAALGDGLDVIGLGGYVILPPSLHPDTGLPYEWEYGPDEMLPQPTPPWLEVLITGEGSASLPSSAQERAVGAEIPQGMRETTLVRLAGSMRHQGATGEEILVALEVVNQRCVPPVSEADLQRMAKSVERYAPAPTLQVAAPPPVVAKAESQGGETAGEVAGWETPWRSYLLTNKQGDITPNASNLSLILAHHPFWRLSEHRLWWDSVRQVGMLGDTPMDPDTITSIAEWLGTEERVSVTQLTLLDRVTMKVCRASPRDPIQEWLAALPPWDGVERLCHWMIDHAEVPNTPYGQEVSRLWPVSMVARALQPGCQYRSVIVLEGGENIGKSKLVKAMAGDWYRSLSTGLDSKEAHMLLHGAWLVELEEMSSLRKTEEARLKAFITLEEDAYIPKYSNLVVTEPRRALFVGTHNPEGDGRFFTGQTGNTRFLPVEIPGVNIDDVLANRDQLFAEALVYYHQHSWDWWRLSDAAEAEAAHAREDRRQESSYEEALAVWLARHPRENTTLEELRREFLGASLERWTRAMQMELAKALRGLGWRKGTREYQEGEKRQTWLPPGKK